jgi:hypothetical protein
MMHLYMHSSTEWSSSVQMGLNAVSIHGSSPTPPIILRSVFLIDNPLVMLNLFIRVLLATIRDKGLCPCPRCLTPKTKLDLLGRYNDSGPRKTLRTYMRNLVLRARSFIYEKAIPIAGAAIEDTLKPMSLVPTLVRALPSRLGNSLLV